jgi:hypothetical protein
MKPKKSIFQLLILCIICFSCDSSSVRHTKTENLDYTLKSNWAFLPDAASQEIDVFFVAPTAFKGDSCYYSMSMNDSTTIQKFIGSINMERGIYDNGEINFYAPFYRQVGLYAFKDRGIQEKSLNPNINAAFVLAYDDVEAAFKYYLSISDRPFILAGFSQGAEYIIKLMQKTFTPAIYKRHIATYAIGWRLTPDDLGQFVQPAKAEIDLGKIICFSAEAPHIKTSIIVPDTTYSINPISWTTDSTIAKAKQHLGACFTDYSGTINKEIPYFTGAYLEPNRGTLKVTDVDIDEYPPVLSIFQSGEYHIYDYSFFYKNLQNNVKKRISNYKQHFFNN